MTLRRVTLAGWLMDCMDMSSRPDDDPEYRLAGLDPLYSSYAKLRVRDILESLEPWGPPHVERPLVHPSSRRIISRVEARALASPRALR